METLAVGMSDAVTHSTGSSNLLFFFNITVLIAYCLYGCWVKWRVCIPPLPSLSSERRSYRYLGEAFWERMAGILQWLFLLWSTQVVSAAVTMPMSLTCVWCSLNSGPVSRDSISLFTCLITLLSWKSCFLMCHHVLRRSQFLHHVRFREAGGLRRKGVLLYRRKWNYCENIGPITGVQKAVPLSLEAFVSQWI